MTSDVTVLVRSRQTRSLTHRARVESELHVTAPDDQRLQPLSTAHCAPFSPLGSLISQRYRFAFVAATDPYSLSNLLK